MVKIMENPIKIDDLGVPLFLETPIYIYILMDIQIYMYMPERMRFNDVCRMHIYKPVKISNK